MENKIVIPYFNIYASDFKAFKDKMTADEFIEVIDAISDICLFGDSEFETENRFQMMFFYKVKENLLKNIPKYKSCVENGKKGGRPRKEITQKKPIGFNSDNPNKTQTKPIKEKKRKDNIIKENIIKEKKNNDPYCSNLKQYFIDEYKKVFNTKPFLSMLHCNKLYELNAEISEFDKYIPIVLKKLKAIDWDINFKPSASWLLKDDNFISVLNGEHDRKKTDSEISINNTQRNINNMQIDKEKAAEPPAEWKNLGKKLRRITTNE